MRLTFSGELWYWRGPAPWYFVTVPEPECQELKEISPEVSYGWGMIPARVTIGETTWATALFPKDGRYLVPVTVAVRRAATVDEGDVLSVQVDIAEPGQPLDDATR